MTGTSLHPLRRWFAAMVANPTILVSAGVVLVALYCFAIGRPRYESRSQFIVRQPLPPSSTAPSVVGPLLAGPTMLGSLEDGRYLGVYLHSPQVMQRVFLPLLYQGRYARKGFDPWAGLPSSSNADQQLDFFKRQVQVLPDDLSGVIELTTTALDPQTALQLNKMLLRESQQMVNQMNQDISRNQLTYASQEVQRARQQLAVATAKLNGFRSRFGAIDPVLETASTSNYITALEAKLVDAKVELASLQRQFRDPQAPEVEVVADQVQELERQIRDERAKVVDPKGRDLGGKASEAARLQSDVAFATESLRAAMTAVENTRMESQRQLKFLVELSAPRLSFNEDWDWRWKLFLGMIGIGISLYGVISFARGAKVRR